MRKIPQKNYKSFSDFQLIGDSSSEAVIVAVTPFSDTEKSNLCMLFLSGVLNLVQLFWQFCKLKLKHFYMYISLYPGLSEKFSLPVGQHCFLMSTRCNVEDIPFLELGVDKASQAASISLKSATLTNPKFRYGILDFSIIAAPLVHLISILIFHPVDLTVY